MASLARFSVLCRFGARTPGPTTLCALFPSSIPRMATQSIRSFALMPSTMPSLIHLRMVKKKGGKADQPKSVVGEFDMNKYREKMEKSVAKLKRDMQAVRIGRADPGILEHIKVEAYGARSPMLSVGQVAVKGPQLLVVSVYDSSITSAVARAIKDSKLDVDVVEEGSAVQVIVPKPSNESRQSMIKLASKYSEEVSDPFLLIPARVALRKIRKDCIDELKKQKNSGLSEDEYFKLEKEVQGIMEKFTKEVNDFHQVKEKELNSS